MIADECAAARLANLSRIVVREVMHLARTEASVSRFGRLQDTLGDKLLPAWIAVHGERIASFVDNLDRAEKLGIIGDAQTWLDMRKLRNQMVHEYIEDPVVLASALSAGHDFVPALIEAWRGMSAKAAPGETNAIG